MLRKCYISCSVTRFTHISNRYEHKMSVTYLPLNMSKYTTKFQPCRIRYSVIYIKLPEDCFMCDVSALDFFPSENSARFNIRLKTLVTGWVTLSGFPYMDVYSHVWVIPFRSSLQKLNFVRRGGGGCTWDYELPTVAVSVQPTTSNSVDETQYPLVMQWAVLYKFQWAMIIWNVWRNVWLQLQKSGWNDCVSCFMKSLWCTVWASIYQTCFQ